jgi:hypothetical protein
MKSQVAANKHTARYVPARTVSEPDIIAAYVDVDSYDEENEAWLRIELFKPGNLKLAIEANLSQ